VTTRGRKAVLILGAVLPTLVVLALSFAFVSRIPTGTGLATSGAPEMLASVSSDLNQLVLAVIGGTAFLFRERADLSSYRFWVVGSIGLATAIGSYYAGYRFRTGLARQLADNQFFPHLIDGRLAAQGLLLMLSFSALIVLALIAYLPANPVETASDELVSSGDRT
jgi:hypothetical protein